MKSPFERLPSGASNFRILIFVILFGPYLEVLFWDQRQLIHLLVYSFIFLLLVLSLFQNVLYFNFDSLFALSFLLYLTSLLIYNLLNSQSIHRSTWTLFIIGAIFANMQYSQYAHYSVTDAELRYFRSILKITLLGHILLIIFSNLSYEKLSVAEINPIPLLSISLATGIYLRDRLLFLTTIIATYYSFTFSLQLSTIFVFLSIPLTEILVRLKPKYFVGLIICVIVSYLVTTKSLLKLILSQSLKITSNNIEIRIQMNNYAQAFIDQNPWFGSHLVAPLSLAIARGGNTSLLPFHSDIMAILVACGGIGFFLYFSNILSFFYKVSLDYRHGTLQKIAKVGLVSSLLTGIVNPVFPGYSLLFCLVICLI